MDSDAWWLIYKIGAWLVGVVVFIGLYIFAIVKYGYLLGVGLGWLPAIIIATLAALAWPLLAMLILLIVYESVVNP